jgi:hypothetical protein
VEQITQSPYEGNLVHFLNDNTDQLMTPNHRVYKKHRIRQVLDGIRVVSEEMGWNTQEAGDINRWNNIRLPLAGFQAGAGIGGERLASLLAWVWTEGGFDKSGSGVRIYQSSTNQPYVDEIQSLLDIMVPGHSKYVRVRDYKGRKYTEHCWYFSGKEAEQIRGLLPNKHPTWELLWGMDGQEKQAFLDASLKGDGSLKPGTAGAFYQKNPDDLMWFQTLLHLMGKQGRVNLKKSCVGVHNNPGTQLQGRHLKSSIFVSYKGIVWCVKVPTGAFMARRNGLIFITGNSGFPKSLNVGKALQKMGSDESEKWVQFGTALKPAFEPFIVGHKPTIE